MSYFKPEFVIENLNRIIAHYEGELSIAEYKENQPNIFSFPGLIERHSERMRTGYKKSAKIDHENFFLIDLEYTRTNGMVVLESGEMGFPQDNEFGFSRVRIKTSREIDLFDKSTLPEFSINILEYILDPCNPSGCPLRDDRVKRFGIWRKTDLSNILPTEWFLGIQKEGYEFPELPLF